MRRPSEIAAEELSMSTLVELTSAFEGIASMRLSQIKDQVLHSTEFFDQLWKIYSQIKVEDFFNFGRTKTEGVIDKELYIIITAEGGFSGDIDQKLVQLMLSTYDAEKHVILVVGHHGAIQLAQRGIPYKKYFKMPVSDSAINVMPLIREVQQYRSTQIFYQEYASLTMQNVKSIELSKAIEQKGGGTKKEDVISEASYIFEPSSITVSTHLEKSLMQIAISQLIMESKLAQYASRFRAMTSARETATDMRTELHTDYNRSRRAVKDERLKEIINGMKKGKASKAAAGAL